MCWKAANGAPGATRPAVGAQATVWLPGGQRMVAEVDGGSGHSGKRAPELHFGLGKIAPGTPLRIDLRYRDNTGHLYADSVRLTPGRHTLVLGGARTPPPPALAAQGATKTTQPAGMGKAG